MLKGVLVRIFGRLPRPLRQLATRLMNARFLVGVVAVVRNEAGDVLMLEHVYRPVHPFGLPAGWMKRGEDPSAAIAREVAEECGLRIDVHEVLAVTGGPRPRRVDVWMRCTVAAGSFRPSAEVTAMAWRSPDSLSPEHRAIVLRVTT